MFAYCGNNPITRTDSGGEWWHVLVGAVVGVAVQYASDVVSNLATGKTFKESLKPTSTLADYGAAALSGALAATGVGVGVSIAANAAIGGATYVANCAIKGEEINELDLAGATIIGGISGAIGGSGANGAKLRGVIGTSRQYLKTAVSPAKIAMYTGKIRTSFISLGISTVRTTAAGFASNGLNAFRKWLTHSAA